MNGIFWFSQRRNPTKNTPMASVRPLRFESMEQRVVLSATGITGAADTAEAETDDSIWIDIGYPVQANDKNAVDDQTSVPSTDIEADLNVGSILRTLLASAATEAAATDAAFEKVYDSLFVDTATGAAADDLVGGHLDDTLGIELLRIHAQVGQVLTFDLGDVINPANGNAGDDVITIDLAVILENVAPDNQDRAGLGNNAVQNSGGPNGTVAREFDDGAMTAGVQPLDLTVVVSIVKVLKTPNPSTVPPGDVVTFTVVLDHTVSSSADAFDLQDR